MQYNQLTDTQKKAILFKYLGQKAIKLQKNNYVSLARELMPPLSAFCSKFDEHQIENLSLETIFFYKPEFITLVLHPLETMSQEHALDIARVATGKEYKDHKITSIEWNNTSNPMHFTLRIDFSVTDNTYPADFSIEITTLGVINLFLIFKDTINLRTWARSYNIYERMIQLGYSMPMYIEPDHPDNGKTPIEMAMAISYQDFKTTHPNEA